MRYIFITTVWREPGKHDFVKTWLESCLPLQFGRGNIDSLDREDVYVIYTDPQSKIALPSCDWQGAKIRFEVNTIACSEVGHGKMMEYHRMAIAEYAKNNTCLVFLSPDVLYGEGTFAKVKNIVESGWKAITLPMYRVFVERMSPIIRTKIRNGAFSYPKRQLVAESIWQTHLVTRSLFWDEPKYRTEWPSHIYWHAPAGILGHVWHQQPLAVVIDRPVRTEGTIDADLIIRCGHAKEDVYVVLDSDDICAVEMSSAGSHSLQFLMRVVADWPFQEKVEAVKRWAKVSATVLDHYLFEKPVFWHAEDLNEEWNKVADEARHITKHILGEE